MKQHLLSPAKRMLLSVFLNSIGNGMQTITMSLLLYKKTGSVFAFGLVILFEHVISLLLHLFAGSIVDRGNPKWICVICDLSRGFIIILVSIAMTITDHVLVWALILTFVINICKPFYRSALFTIGPAVAQGDSLTKYNSYTGTYSQLGVIMGATCAGPLVQATSASVAFMINGFSYIFAGLTILLTVIPPINVKKTTGCMQWWGRIWEDWKEIYHYVKRDFGLITQILLSSGDYLVIIFINLILVPLIAERFLNQSLWLATFEFSFAFGSIIMSYLTVKIIERLGNHIILMMGILLQGMFLSAISIVQNPVLLIPIFLGIGGVNAVSIITYISNLQKSLYGSIKGRISALRQLSLSLFSGVGITIVSIGIEVSLNWGILFSGMICLVFGMIAWYVFHPRRSRISLHI